MRTILAAAVLALAAVPVHAASLLEGRVLVSMNAENAYELYEDSFKERQGYPSAWFLVEYATPEDGVRSARQLMAARCDSEEIGLASSVDYAGQTGTGKVVSQINRPAPTQWSMVSPDTAGEAVFRVLCALSSGAAADVADAMATYAYSDDEAEVALRRFLKKGKAAPAKAKRRK